MGHGGAKQTEDSDIDRTPEYEAFMKELATYHQQRGTNLQREPALGPRRISLLKLYQKIISYGGYDKVSDTSLMWRRIADEYHVPPMSNAGMPGYLLKSMYYKNLAAFEIERHWGKKAPPPELLEQLTARGGAISTRPDINNPSPRPPQSPSVQVKSIKAPAQVKQSHQQQVVFPQHHNHPPPHMVVPIQVPVTHSTEYIRAEPQTEYMRPLYPITAGQFSSQSLHDASTNHLQPLITRKFIEQHKPSEIEEYRSAMSGLYRARMALKSGIESEMRWAMKTLIRASYERAEDFLLERIGDLSEVLLTLLQKGIEELKKQDASTTEMASADDEAMQRSKKRVKLHGAMRFAQDFRCPVPQALEAGLILRNLLLHIENAKFLVRIPLLTGILTQGLALSDVGENLEMRQYCSEIAESIASHLQLSSEEDPLYRVLAGLLDTDDRSQLLLGLRSLGRLSVVDEHNRLLQDIRPPLIAKLIQFLQLDDAELLTSLTAFFFQWTTYRANLTALSKQPEAPTLLKRLIGLTMWQAQEVVDTVSISDSQTVSASSKQPPAQPPQLSEEIVRELLTFQEPERAIHWMRACFEMDLNQSVTQILLWQSYRTLFTPYSLPQQNGSITVSGKPLLQAADVIKMVGNAFEGATAMVTNHPSEGQKFIIRGIKCRDFPLAPSGKKYVTCQWETEEGDKTTCSAPFATSKDLHRHIMEKHVEPMDEASIECRWVECQKLLGAGEKKKLELATHLRIHTSDALDAQKNTPRTIRGSQLRIQNYRTMLDDKGEPRGIALTAILTLRNIVRSEAKILKTPGLPLAQLRTDLLDNLVVNPAIAAYYGEVLAALD